MTTILTVLVVLGIFLLVLFFIFRRSRIREEEVITERLRQLQINEPLFRKKGKD